MTLSLTTQALRSKLLGFSSGKTTAFSAKPLAGLASYPSSNNSSSSDAAVEVSLSSKANRKTAKINTSSTVNADGTGVIGNLFKEIGSISEKIRDLNEKSGKLAVGGSEQTLIAQEVKALNDRYQEILGSKEYQQINDISQQITSLFQSGVSSDLIARGLAGSSNLFGQGLISRIKNGDLAGFKDFTTSIDSLGQFSGQDISSSAALDQIDNAVKVGLSSLSSDVIPGLPAGREAQGLQSNGRDLPELLALPFLSQGDLSLVVRTYSSEDIVRAAQAHLPLDPKTVLSLASNVDQDAQRKKIDDYKEGSDQDKFSTTQNKTIQSY